MSMEEVRVKDRIRVRVRVRAIFIYFGPLFQLWTHFFGLGLS